MVDSAPRLYPSCVGDAILPGLLSTSIQTAGPVVQRSVPVQAGLLIHGSRGRVLNRSLPNPAWLAPEDLDKVFVTQHAESGVPSGVQRDLLEEACLPSELQATANLNGSKLAATEVDDILLAAHPSGQIGELLSLSVLGRTPEGQLQGKKQSHTQAAGSPILQLSWNRPLRSQDRLLLACRTSHWICLYEASAMGTEEDSCSPTGDIGVALAWSLQPVAAHQTAVRICHIAWNPQLTSLIGFVCEDGSLHMADADLQVGEARLISMGAGTFPPMQAHPVDASEKEALHHRHARLVCEWGLHPFTLLLAAGAQLLRYDIRKPGAGCAPRPIHTLPDGDALVALAPMCHATSASRGRQLLAASTLHCVMLLDLRRPQQALLKWPHGHRREPPQLLSMYSIAEPEEAHTDADPFTPPGPPYQGDSPMDSLLQDSAADAEAGAHTVETQPDVLASQYGSSTQPLGSQQPLCRGKLAHVSGMMGTQASQASPAECHRNPMADTSHTWPVSWHAGAPEPLQSNPLLHPRRGGSFPLATGLQARICAGSIGSGYVLLYSFTCSAPEAEVRAWPPAGGQAGATSEASQPAVGSIKVNPIPPAQQQASQPGQHDGQQAQDSMPKEGPPEPKNWQPNSGEAATQDSAGFTWRPAGMTATIAQGLPRRICWPLKAVERLDSGLEGLSPDVAQQLEEAHREGPDLTGMAVLPPPSASGSPGATLLRRGFLGHVSAQPFADPVALPGLQGAQPPAADAVHDVFPRATASVGPAAAQRSRRAGARGPLCSMSGHHRIAQAAIGASGTEADGDAEVPAQMREALSSLLQETKVPLSLWEVAQELGREGTGQRAEGDPSIYRRRMGSVVEGAPVTDYTTEGSRASRLQRWEKLQTDTEGLAAARFQQALSAAGGGDGILFTNPTWLRSTLAAIAGAASTGVSGSSQALQLREGLSIPRQTSLADARDALQSSGAARPAQGSQIASLTATQSQASPLVQRSGVPQVELDRSCGTGDIIYPTSQSRPQVAAEEGSQPAHMSLRMQRAEVTDEAAGKALEEMERDWTDFEQRMSRTVPSKAPAQPCDLQTSGQGQKETGTRRASAIDQPSGVRKVKRPGGPLGSQTKTRRSAAASRASMPFEEGFS